MSRALPGGLGASYEERPSPIPTFVPVRTLGPQSNRMLSFPRSTRSSSFEDALEHGQGVLHLVPNWVPRSFCVPGRRIRLHPDDYFALGGERGGIDERWLSSTVRADNGPSTGTDEGLSFVLGPDREALPFDEVVAHLGAGLIGRASGTRRPKALMCLFPG